MFSPHKAYSLIGSHSWLMVVMLFLGQGAVAQTNVTAGFARDTIIIGDLVNYTVTIKMDQNNRVLAVSGIALDSIISGYQTQRKSQRDTLEETAPQKSDYDIEDWGRWRDRDDQGFWQGGQLSFDTTRLGNQLLLENTIQIRFWEPGAQYVSNPPVIIATADSTSIIQPTGQAQVFVAPPFDIAELEQDSIDISPIKSIIKEEKNITDYYWLFALLGIALLGFLFWVLSTYLKKREAAKEVVVEEVIIPAHVIALENLDKLDQDQLWQQGKIKEYQSRLTFTIREYLENRYDIPALESTTEEIKKALKTSDFDAADETELKNILQVADMVKFAKMTPAEELHQQFLDKAYAFVNKTKRTPKSEVDE